MLDPYLPSMLSSLLSHMRKGDERTVHAAAAFAAHIIKVNKRLTVE